MNKFKLYFASLLTTFLVISGLFGNADAQVSFSAEGNIYVTGEDTLSSPDEDLYDTLSPDEGNIFSSCSLNNTKRQIRSSVRRKCNNNVYSSLSADTYFLSIDKTYRCRNLCNVMGMRSLQQDYIILQQKLII